jgi:hypothetical protein
MRILKLIVLFGITVFAFLVLLLSYKNLELHGGVMNSTVIEVYSILWETFIMVLMDISTGISVFFKELHELLATAR